MESFAIGLAIAIAVIVSIAFVILHLLTRYYRKVEQGQAMIINPFYGELKVAFTGHIVFPVINTTELVDVSIKKLEIQREKEDGLICQDNVRADIRVSFYVRVNKTREAVLQVAHSVGCKQTFEADHLQQLFTPIFSDALKTVGKQLPFDDLYINRDSFREGIIKNTDDNLHSYGYTLEDVAIDYLEQTPIASLDPSKIQDAEGIRQITERTADQHIKTNERRKKEEETIAKQNADNNEILLEQNKRKQIDAARKNREVEVATSEEKAKAMIAQQQARFDSENSRLDAERKIGEIEQQKLRDIELIELERRQIRDSTDQEVQQSIHVKEIIRLETEGKRQLEKELALQQAQIQVATAKHQRLLKEQQVAQAEEDVAMIRVKEDVSRDRERQITLAKAKYEAADQETKAMKLLAEGKKADHAATGLAEAEVKEENLKAEARGLAEKLAALSTPEGMEYEKFRLELEQNITFARMEMTVQQAIAQMQSTVLAEAFGKANIDLIGGEQHFVENILKATARGKVLDQHIHSSENLTTFLHDYLEGDANLLKDVKEAVSGASGKHMLYAGVLYKLLKDYPELKEILARFLKDFGGESGRG